jgi:hypothetical protein
MIVAGNPTDDELAAIAAALVLCDPAASEDTPGDGPSPWLLAARREAVGIE